MSTYLYFLYYALSFSLCKGTNKLELEKHSLQLTYKIVSYNNRDQSDLD